MGQLSSDLVHIHIRSVGINFLIPFEKYLGNTLRIGDLMTCLPGIMIPLPYFLSTEVVSDLVGSKSQPSSLQYQL